MTNDITLSTTDEKFPDSVTDFIKEYDKRHPGKVSVGTHNIYHVQSIDMDGNVTQEAFALNVCTDHGMRGFYNIEGEYPDGTFYYNFYCKYIYIGNGTEIDKSQKTLTSPLPTSQSNETTVYNSRYGLKYNKEKNILTMRWKGVSGLYEYNYSNMTQDYDVTEIGIGYSADHIFFHSLIYDTDGNVSKIQKKMNQRLTITTYHSICMRPDMFKRMYDKGMYVTFDPCEYFSMGYADRGIWTWLSANWYPHEYIDRYGNTTYSNWGFWINDDDSVLSSEKVTNQNGTFKYTLEKTQGTRTIEDKRSYISQILLNTEGSGGTGNWNRSFFGKTYIFLDEPESISYNLFRTNSWTNTDFWAQFGLYSNIYGNNSHGGIPALDFDMKKLSMYNYQTKQWDIEESFTNNPEKLLYDQITYLGPACGVWMWVPELNRSLTAWIFINCHPDRPITKFNSSGIVLYASDTWWDTSTWIHIPNLSAVQENAQCKRYIIETTDLNHNYNSGFSYDQQAYNGTGYNYYCWKNHPKIVRDQQLHQLVYNDGRGHKQYQYPNRHYNIVPNYVNCKYTSSDSVGYVTMGEVLIYPDTIDESTNLPKRYEIRGYQDQKPRSDGVWNPGERNVLIIFGESNYNKGCRIYTVSEDPSIEPGFIDVPYGIALPTSNLYYSYSDEGFVLISDRDNKRLVVIDITGMLNGGSEPTITIVEEILVGHAIGCTNYCCCRVPSDEDGLLKFKIIDMRNPNGIISDLTEPDPNLNTFKLPQDHTYQGMCGWNNFVYIATNVSGVNWTFCYYIREKRYSQLTWSYVEMMRTNNNSYYTHIERCVDDCMVLCGSNRSNTDRHVLFRASDPENPYHIMIDGVSWDECAGNVKQNAAQLKYLDESKQQLMLIVNANRVCVYDIGRIIDDGVPQTFVFNHLYPWRNYDGHGGVIFRKNVVYREFNSSSRDMLYIEPIEQFIDHHVEGTTWTINSFNNPVKVTAGIKNFQLEISNVLSNYGEEYNPTPSPIT